jgi:hypothetical protein
MNSTELEILQQIEQGLLDDDAAFAQMIADGPCLSLFYKIRFTMVSFVGIVLVMLFPVNIALAVAGYVVLIAAGTDLLRRRALKPVDVSPLETFHRLSAGLFRNDTGFVEPSLD